MRPRKVSDLLRTSNSDIKILYVSGTRAMFGALNSKSPI